MIASGAIAASLGLDGAGLGAFGRSGFGSAVCSCALSCFGEDVLRYSLSARGGRVSTNSGEGLVPCRLSGMTLLRIKGAAMRALAATHQTHLTRTRRGARETDASAIHSSLLSLSASLTSRAESPFPGHEGVQQSLHRWIRCLRIDQARALHARHFLVGYGRARA